MKSKIIGCLLVVFNVIYVVLGCGIYIMFDITSPNDPKFDVNQNYRTIIFPILMIVCIIGEIFILQLLYKKVFNLNSKQFAIYMVFNVLVCLSPMLISLIEKLF